MENGTYSVETRTNQSDYSEEHNEFNTPEEVKQFISKLDNEEEHVHSVLFYADGTTSNPKDVTRKFI